MSTYTQMRYIAYQVPTVGYGAAGFLEMPKENAATNQLILDGLDKPVIDNLSNDDAKQRVACFYLAMNKAANALTALADDRFTLKVFVAPEFYFRPTSAEGTNGPSYSYEQYKEIKAALISLSNDAKFKNWLIIPGTIMWTGTGTMGKRPPTIDNIYFNTCPYIKVGTFNTQSHVIEKEQSSHIDGLPTGSHGVPPIFGPPGSKATDEVWTIYQTRAKKEKHVIEHYGIQCGVEICLEHGRALLKDILSDLVNWQVGTVRKVRKSISLQILTSGGMGIIDANVAVVNNGYILRNDGLANVPPLGAPPPPPQVEIKKVLRYSNKNFGTGLTVSYGSKPGFAQFDPTLITAERTEALAGRELVPSPAGNLPGYYFPHNIILYNRVPLP